MKTEFKKTLWADPAFAEEFRENADHYLPDRHYLFHVLRSFFRYSFKQRSHPVICDLGCGDGVLAEQLLKDDPSLLITLIDGSQEMLEAARARLSRFSNLNYLAASFEALIRHEVELGPFDFLVSSFSIHHLHQPDKAALFQVLFDSLNRGGRFLNIDTVLPNEPAFKVWYYALWREWILTHEAAAPLPESFTSIPAKARKNPDNKLSSLAEQLAALTQAGFIEVDCHYRNGLFVIYSGRKL